MQPQRVRYHKHPVLAVVWIISIFFGESDISHQRLPIQVHVCLIIKRHSLSWNPWLLSTTLLSRGKPLAVPPLRVLAFQYATATAGGYPKPASEPSVYTQIILPSHMSLCTFSECPWYSCPKLISSDVHVLDHLSPNPIVGCNPILLVITPE